MGAVAVRLSQSLPLSGFASLAHIFSLIKSKSKNSGASAGPREPCLKEKMQFCLQGPEGPGESTNVNKNERGKASYSALRERKGLERR